LFCGPTGTGKTVYIKNVLLNELDKAIYNTLIEVGFSAQTNSTQVQDIIDGRLDRRGKNLYGPKLGKAVLFVDDLNMPAKEKYGAQPPIELLRQFIDQGGWYDNRDKEKAFRSIVDVVMVAAMGSPGGGRSFITPRLMRHFHLISLTQFEDDSLTRIFSTILRWYFTTHSFNTDIVKAESKVVAATLEVYKESIKKLLPTPTKSHYLFNLRDFSKVILGVCFADKEKITTVDGLARLWAHEAWRVFSDRLTNDPDRMVIFGSIRDNIKKNYSLNFDTLFDYLDLPDKNGKLDGKIDTIEEFRRLLFTDIVKHSSRKVYEEVRDWSKLQSSVESMLKMYCDTNGGKSMNLVMFSFAIEHLLIINRILKQPGGNALLIGVGGSGRQSLTRLAAFIGDQTVFQIEINKQYGKQEWMEDLKLVLKGAGKDQ
jgi:dynein heavy chain